MLAENEELFDNKDHGLKAFERASGPKKLVIVPGIKHYGIYIEARKQAQELAHRLVRRAPEGRQEISESAGPWRYEIVRRLARTGVGRAGQQRRLSPSSVTILISQDSIFD